MTRLAIYVSLALFAALCGPALCGLVYTANDLGAFHLPLRDFYARAVHSGDRFDWCPHLFGGFYLTGEGQVGTYHPLHLLLYRFLPLAWAWNLECVLSYPLLFAGTWLLMRRCKLAQAEALFGALVFTFCGFNLLHFVHVNAVAVIAHIPWLLYGIERLEIARRNGDRRGLFHYAVLVALLTGSQLLLGYPQYVAYSLIAECLYLLSVGKLQTAVGWTLGKLLGVGLGAVQLLPTIEALVDSVRQETDASFAAWGSLHPLNAVQLVAPYLFETRVVGQNTHELTLYIGSVPLLLALVAIINRRNRVTAFAAGLVFVGGLLTLGEYSPLHRVTTAFPAVGYFRFPCRALVLVELGAGLLAAVGFALLAGAMQVQSSSRINPVKNERFQHGLRLPKRCIALTVVGSVALAIGAPLVWPDFVAEPALVWCSPLLLLIAAVLVNRSAAGKRWALAALVPFTAFDLGAYGLSAGPYREASPLASYIAQTAPPVENGRVALDLMNAQAEGLRAGNQILLSGGSRIDGYAGLEPARRLDYRRMEALRLAGVSAIAMGALAYDKQRMRDRGDGWLEVPDPLPRCRLVQAALPTSDPALFVTQVNIDTTALIRPDDTALVKGHLGKSSASNASAGLAVVVSDRPGSIVITMEAPAGAMLVLSESYHRGWAASIDGRAVPTLRVNGDFLGTLVDAGRSQVEFRFQPASLMCGRLLSVCGLGFLGLLLAACRLWPARRHPAC